MTLGKTNNDAQAAVSDNSGSDDDIEEISVEID
jgi:hypothetical protein